MTKRLFSKTVVVVAVSLLAASAVHAAGGGGHAVDSGVLLKDFIYRIFNFAITIGILAYFITKPMKKGLSDRSQGIADQLAEAKKVKEEAEEKFAGYEAKLTKANAEIDELRAAIVAEGKAEKEKIIAAAETMAAKIKADAKLSADYEIAKATQELRQETVKAAIRMAEEILKKNFSSEDQARLVAEYSQKVGELH